MTESSHYRELVELDPGQLPKSPRALLTVGRARELVRDHGVGYDNGADWNEEAVGRVPPVVGLALPLLDLPGVLLGDALVEVLAPGSSRAVEQERLTREKWIFSMHLDFPSNKFCAHLISFWTGAC